MNRTFYIAGVQFRPQTEIKAAAKEMKVGGLLKLYPEPSNKFDPNAVKIYSIPDPPSDEAYFLGYVPKKFSSEVSALLSIGAPVECVIDEVNPEAKTYEMFKVTIKEVDEEAKEEDPFEDRGEY